MTEPRKAHEAPGFQLLFTQGERPDYPAIADFIGDDGQIAIVHEDREDGMTELLDSGFTFDLVGLPPATELSVLKAENLFDVERSPDRSGLEALLLRPGQHVGGGSHLQPVMRKLADIACRFVRHFENLSAIGWSPASSAMGAQYFDSVASDWIGGGPFPALGLTAFREGTDGSIESVGLAHWIGQEIRIEPPLSTNRVEATRLGVRLVNYLVDAGPVEGAERLTAPDGGPLVLRGTAGERFIRVRRE